MKKTTSVDEGAVQELARQMTEDLERPRPDQGSEGKRAERSSQWTDSFRASGGKHATM